MIGTAYQSGKMSLLVISRINDTYIVALQKYVSKCDMFAQFPFVPIHKSALADFINSAEVIGNFTPSSIEASMEVWKKHESAYFTVGPAEIWDIGISLLSKSQELSDFARGKYFLFPPIFPGTLDTLDGFEGVAGILDHSIGEKFNPVSN